MSNALEYGMPRSAFHFGISMNRVIALYGTGFPINPKAISMKLTYFILQFLSNILLVWKRIVEGSGGKKSVI
jgi:hypothetical protein